MALQGLKRGILDLEEVQGLVNQGAFLTLGFSKGVFFGFTRFLNRSLFADDRAIR